MNVTTGLPSSGLENTTFPEEENADLETLIARLRVLYVQAYYGEHYHLIFMVCFVLCIIGYLTNTLNIAVFARMPLSNSMNLFLLIMSASDIALITTQLAHIVLYFEGFTILPFYGHFVFSMTCTFLESIFSNVSNWMVAIAGIWRYVVITWPERCSKWFKPTRVKIVIILVFSFSVLLALPMFLFFTYNTVHFRGCVFYDQKYTDFAMLSYRLPLKIYWGFLILRGIVPMIIMTITTGGLVWSLCKPHKPGEKGSTSYRLNLRITIMLIVLLVLFLLSNLPNSFMVLISVVSGGDTKLLSRYRKATDIIRVFMLANNSLSFFIYLGLGYEFRRTFMNTIFPCCKANASFNSVTDSVNGNAEMEYPDKNDRDCPLETIGTSGFEELKTKQHIQSSKY